MRKAWEEKEASNIDVQYTLSNLIFLEETSLKDMDLFCNQKLPIRFA